MPRHVSGQEEAGAASIEYVLVGALVAVVILLGAAAAGGVLGGFYNDLAVCVQSPGTCPLNE